MNWNDIQDGIKDAVELAAGSGIKAAWDRRASGWRDKVHIKLDVRSVERVGHSESLREYDAETDSIRQVEKGARVLVLQVAAESDSQELSKSSLAVAERVRSRLPLLEVRALVEATGLALASTGPVSNASYTDPGDAGRHVSRAVFDVRFNAMNYETGLALGFIDTVTVDGDVYGDGVDVDGAEPPRLATSWAFAIDDASSD